MITIKNPCISELLKNAPALNDANQHNDNGYHQQDVDKPAHRVTAHQPKQP
jgi:hypothetical protein